METLGLFLGKSIVVSGLLMAWYFLGLRGKRLHQYNRFFLLATLGCSLIIPFFHFEFYTIPQLSTGNFAPVSLLLRSGGNTGNNIINAQQEQTFINWQSAVAIVIACISITMLIILVIKIVRVQRLCRQYNTTKISGIKLILTDSPKAPFVFLRYLFWNKAIPLEGKIGQLIFKHELTHIEHGHTYDKLACQLLTCIFWFNPFYWIIQKELAVVHEFAADEYAVSNGDPEVFAMMLLQSYNNGSYLEPHHRFFSSPVRRRLAMIQNVGKPSHFRRFIAVPLIAVTILLFSFNARNTGNGPILPAKKKIILLLDAGHGGNDPGLMSGGYTEKEICLRYAARLRELSSAYNIEVKLTGNIDRDVSLTERMAIVDKSKPDVFITLLIDDKPGKQDAKRDFDMYVSADNGYIRQSTYYSSSIFQTMEKEGIITGMPGVGNHIHSPTCGCSPSVSAMQFTDDTKNISLETDGIQLLKHAQAPAMAMVLGNIKNHQRMQQLNKADRVDMLCHAILKGIVDGAEGKGFTGNALTVWPVSNPGCKATP